MGFSPFISLSMDFKNNVLPHLLAVIIFALVTAIFYSPLVFSGKSLNQHDIQQGLGASQEIIDHRDQTGDEALWTNSMFGGMPAYLINMRWSGDLMLHLQRAISLWLPSPASVTLVSCLTFYLLLLVFGVRPCLAIAGGLAYSLGSFNIVSIEAGHMWKMWAMAYMPLVLAAVHLAFNKKYLWGLALMALGMALELRSNHLQITYYLLLLLLVYGAVHLVYTIRQGQATSIIKPLLFLVGGTILGILCNTGKIWSVYEYGQFSTRGPAEVSLSENTNTSGLDREYAFRWSNGVLEPITLLIPEFYGGPSLSSLPADSNLGQALRANGQPAVQVRQYLQQVNTYWGDQPFVAGPSYAGAIVIFLFILGILVVKGQTRLWLLIATVLSVMLSWGHNFELFNNFMFDYFPGYNKFRSVSMTLVIALMCIPLLGFLGLEHVFKNYDQEVTKKALLRAGLVTAGILALALVYSAIGSFRAAGDANLTSRVPDWYLDALKADRASILRTDSFRSLFLIAIAWALLYFKSAQKSWHLGIAVLLGALTLLDLWGVNKRYLQSDDFVRGDSNAQVVTAADQQILQDTDPNFRVLSLLTNPWSDGQTSYYHKSIGGYHGAKIHRYADVIEGCLSNEMSAIIQGLQNQGRVTGQPVLNMLNTKYLLAGTEAGGALQNPYAQGHAWFVANVVAVNSAQEEFDQLCQLDVARVALVDQSKFSISNPSPGNQGTITLDTYLPNYLRYQSNNSAPGFAVFSEIYYPKGWQATIDGQPVEIKRANYLLRALEVPAGQHTIEFRFVPKVYFLGNAIMLWASIATILLVVGVVFLEIRSKNQA